MNNEIYQAVSAYYISNQGDNRYEIEQAEQEYEMMKLVYGVDAVKEVMDYYAKTVIKGGK
jgi:hypothetical protein